MKYASLGILPNIINDFGKLVNFNKINRKETLVNFKQWRNIQEAQTSKTIFQKYNI